MMMSHLVDLATRREFKSQVLFIPTTGSEEELVEAALIASAHDETPVGQRLKQAATTRLLTLYKEEGRDPEPLSAIRRRVMERNAFLKEGSLENIERWTLGLGGMIHNHLRRIVHQVKGRGGLAVVVANDKIDLGVICFEKIG